MFLALVKKEMLMHLLRYQFLVGAGITFLLFAASLLVLSADHRREREELSANRRAALQAIEDAQKEGDHPDGVPVERPLSPLKVVAQGIERGAAGAARMRGQEPIAFTGAYDRGPVRDFFPPLDLVFVIGALFSLLVFVFAHDSFSGEREQGTLRLLFSFPVPRLTALAAKWLGGLLGLVLPLVLAFLLLLLAYALQPQLAPAADDWIALLAIGLVSLLYIACVYTLALAVSVRCRRSGTAMALLAMTWVALVLLLPNLAPLIAQMVYPVESENAVQNRVADIRHRHDSSWRAERQRRRYQEKPDESREDFLAWREQRGKAVEQAREAEMARVLSGHEPRKARQRAIAVNLARISPYAAYSLAVTRLAQTGIDHGLRLDEHLSSFRDIVQAQMRDRHFGRERSDVRRELRDLPRFQFPFESARERLIGVVPDLCVILGGTVLLLLVALLSFLRLDL